MTKAEIAETQIIVTTPEKWDVVTRKPTGEGELVKVNHIRSKFTPFFLIAYSILPESQIVDH